MKIHLDQELPDVPAFVAYARERGMKVVSFKAVSSSGEVNIALLLSKDHRFPSIRCRIFST